MKTMKSSSTMTGNPDEHESGGVLTPYHPGNTKNCLKIAWNWLFSKKNRLRLAIQEQFYHEIHLKRLWWWAAATKFCPAGPRNVSPPKEFFARFIPDNYYKKEAIFPKFLLFLLLSYFFQPVLLDCYFFVILTILLFFSKKHWTPWINNTLL